MSLGCPKNLVDTETMIGHIITEHQLTNEMDDADVMVLNTCTFIDSATEETIENLYDLKDWKEYNPRRKIIVAGCYVEEMKEKILEEYPFIDGILNTGAISKINKLINSLQETPTKIFEERKMNLIEQDYRVLATPAHYAYLKIGDGCNHGCSFCKIPSLRGGTYFKAPQDILAEAKILAAQGVKEIILIAQDITSYSYNKTYDLADLLKDLENTEKIEWIRLLYLYPDNINKRLIKTIKDSKKIVKYIDMPIQHISDKILSKMNRKSSKQRIIDVINLIRKELPEAKLRTTVIVGFPGEDENDFAELNSFIDQTKFDHLGVFAYSDQKNTVSFKLKGKLEEQTKEKRAKMIIKTQKSISKKLNKSYIGQELEILVDNMNGGRRYFDAPEIDGFVFIENIQPKDIGQFKTVKIKKALQYDLIGELT
ncbi:MAG: 30S ribosomal protein S12 methylthiotransferase RimO [Candidatus Margulisbacteria bacterium]|nr:30S ribosomal protein S12 methylthiotransferase RimO [Candidatus Margulisiibacteriota bacterium]